MNYNLKGIFKMSDGKKLNPQITEFEHGVREIKAQKVYPLSIGDQERLNDLINSVLKGFQEKPASNDIEFFSQLLDVIKEKRYDVLPLVMEMNGKREIDAFFNDLTNNQLIDLVRLIYVMNFEALVKNLTSLLARVPMVPGTDEELLSRRPSLMSASDMDTPLETSMENPSGKEESPTDS